MSKLYKFIISFMLLCTASNSAPAQTIDGVNPKNYPSIGKEYDARAWEENEVHSAYYDKRKMVLIDVNDKFLIESLHNKEKTTIRVAVLDGMRQKYGACGNPNGPKPGDPATTWLSISYSKPDKIGNRLFTIKRTSDFFGQERQYKFTWNKRHGIARLDNGISIEISGKNLKYVQTAGPLGTSGNTTSLQVLYELSDDFRIIETTVQMDLKMWIAGTNEWNAVNYPRYRVNDTTIIPYDPNSRVASSSLPIVVPPLQGRDFANINKELLSVVSEKKSGVREIPNVETEEQRGIGLCRAQRCLGDFQCRFIGDWDITRWCYCEEVSGPAVGVCVL